MQQSASSQIKIALIELKEINGVPSLVVPVNGELKINGIEVELK